MAACRECVKTYQRQHMKENPEIKKAQRARYDPEKKKRDARNDRERHKERIQMQQKRWREANLDHAREQGRRNYLADREHRIEKANEWQRNNPDKVRVRGNRRQARKRALPDHFTQQDWDNAVAYWHGACAYCGKPLYGLFDDIKAHADHFIPLASPNCIGTVPGNMLPACSICNLSKKDTDAKEWLERKFGKRKAKQILEKIRQYFEWLKSGG